MDVYDLNVMLGLMVFDEVNPDVLLIQPWIDMLPEPDREPLWDKIQIFAKNERNSLRYVTSATWNWSVGESEEWRIKFIKRLHAFLVPITPDPIDLEWFLERI